MLDTNSFDKALKQISKNYGTTNSIGPIRNALIILFLLIILDKWVLPSTWITELRHMVFGKGVIPQIILWVALFGLFYLQQIWARIFYPLKVAEQLESDIVQSACDNGLGSQELVSTLRSHTYRGGGGYFYQRFVRLHNLFLNNQDRVAAENLRSEILENDDYMHQLAFSAVKWSEWAMPLLGFLGTVVGIGLAIGSLEVGLQWEAGGKILIKPELIKQSFKGMATAFETTLLGLVGVLIVGLLHAFLKKRMNQALANVEAVFTTAIEKTKGMVPTIHISDFDSVQFEMSEITARMSYINENLEQINVNLDIQKEERKGILNTIETVITEEPRLESIRKILFRPVITFDRDYEQFCSAIEKRISEKYGGRSWGIESISSDSRSDFCMLLIQNRKTGNMGICRVQVPNKNEIDFIPVEGNFNRLIMISQDSAFLVDSEKKISLLEDSSCKIMDRLNTDSGISPEIIPLRMKNELTGTIIILHHGEICNIHYFNPQDRMIDQPVAAALTNIATPITAALSPDNNTLLILESGDNSQLRRITIDKSTNPASKIQIDFQNSDSIALPRIEKIKTLKFLSDNDFMILETNGKLWTMNLDQQYPISVNHSEWEHSKDTVINIGNNSWCGVWFNNKLSMWRMRKGAKIHRYIEIPFLEVDGLKEQISTTTSNGRHLIAGIDRNIAVWRFPEYEFSGGTLGNY